MSRPPTSASRNRDRRPRRRRRKRRDRLFLAGTINLAALVALWALETGVAERHWLTTALTYIPQQPFGLPAAALLLAALFGRNIRAAAVSALALGFLLVTLLGFRVPISRPAATGAELRVLTFNIHMGSYGISRVIDTIRAADPDVFSLQEVASPRGDDRPAALRRAFPEYRFAQSGALMTASRLPVTGVRERSFGQEGLWREGLQVDVRAGGRTVHIVNVHFITARAGHGRGGDSLLSPAHWREAGEARVRQAAAVTAWVRALDGPTVVMGDFNTPPRGLAYGALAGRMRNAFDAAGQGFGYTWNTRLPAMRIDHVFAANGATPVSARVLPARASDHRPVLVRIGLMP